MSSKITKSLLFAFMISVLTVLTVFSVSAKTVTKNKLLYEVSKKTATLVECKSNAKNIKIPSKVGKYKVTAIGEKAFAGKKKLQSVELPGTVKKIGEEAFRNCKALKKVVIPESVTKLGDDIFKGCKKLTVYTVKGSKAERYIKKQDGVTLGYRYMTSLKLDVTEAVLYEGDKLELEVIRKPQKLYSSKVSFSSDRPSVASVSSKGVVTATGEGTAVITCKAKDGSGKKAVCTVTVKTKDAEKAVSLTPKAPSEVTGLTVASVSDSSVSLSWNKIDGATGYKVYLYDESDNTYQYKWAASAAQAEIKGLEPAREYSFSVKAYVRNYYSSADSGAYSERVSAKTLPGRVNEIIADDKLIYPDRLTLSWSGVDGADGYNLYIYSKDEKDYVLYKSTDGLSAEVTGLDCDTDYHFRIKTFSGENKTEGSFSRTFTFTTDYLPQNSQKAAEGFIDALSSTKKLESSFTLYTVFGVDSFEGENEKTKAVIDSLRFKETGVYTFVNGVAEKDGKEITANDVIYPFGKESGLVWADIKGESVTFSQSGYGYSASFDVFADEAKDAVILTDTEKLKAENPGLVLYSFESGDASITTKVTDGKLDYLLVQAPVKLIFILDGEKHEISYTLSQKYILSY